MFGKTIFDGGSPKTQSIEAVKALLAYVGREGDSLPSFIEVGKGEGRVVLVLSNKKDAFYTVTSKACSCPAQTFAPGQACKHQRQHFPQLAKPAATEAGSLRPTGSFKPFSLLPSEEKAAKASPSLSSSMLIDLHDTTDREAAYFSIKEDRVLWPAEA
jgi:hypothetical protein